MTLLLAADTVVFCCETHLPDQDGKSKHATDWEVLLIKRKYNPYKDSWALPGGHVEENEPLDMAAQRELEEETSLIVPTSNLEQVATFGDPGRDPRGWAVTVAHSCIVFMEDKLKVKAADDAKEVKWFPVNDLPELAFDHMSIIQKALSLRIKNS